MEPFDTVSMSSDEGSLSAASSISGLTGYEEEINEIKNLMRPMNGSPCTPKFSTPTRVHQAANILSYQIQIDHLNLELQNAHKLNEKYKAELIDYRKKQDLKGHEKFKRLLSKNAMLEEQFRTRDEQVRELLSKGKRFAEENCKLKEISDARVLEVQKWQNEATELRTKLNELSSELVSAKTEVELKQRCVEELKKTVALQHVQLAEYKQQSGTVQHDIDVIVNESDHIKKSLQWYKERLQTCREEQNRATEELTSLKSELLNKCDELNKSKVEVDNWKCKYREEKREKEVLCQKVSQLECSNSNVRLENLQPTQIDDLRNYYDREIFDLTNEMLKLKNSVQEQVDLFEKVSKENSDLHVRNTTMQKALNDKETKILSLENSKVECNGHIEELKYALNKKEEKLLNCQVELRRLKAALDSALVEKDEISAATAVIRKDFSKFLDMYNRTKSELDNKDRTLMELQKNRQELFMENNWKVCDIEELRHREKEYVAKIGVLSKENAALLKQSSDASEQKRCSELEIQINTLNEENGRLKQDLIDIELKHKDVLNTKIKQRENELRQYYTALFEILCQKLNSIAQMNAEVGSIKDSCTNNNVYREDEDILAKLDSRLSYLRTRFHKVRTYARKSLKDRIKSLEDRCHDVQERCAKTEVELREAINISSIGHANQRDGNDDVIRLRDLLQVKELEMKEKQKRYEVYNRTLLKKIREHMRGRNSAEKQVKYLQELHNSAMEECNDCKLQLSQRDFEIQSFKDVLNVKDRSIEKLQATIVNLGVKIREQHDEISNLKRKVECFDEDSAILKNEKDAQISAKELTVASLKQQLTEVSATLKNLEAEHCHCQNIQDQMNKTINDSHVHSAELMKNIEGEKVRYETSMSKLSALESEHYKCLTEFSQLRMDFNELKEQNADYLKEIEILNSTLRLKDEELFSLKSNKEKSETDSQCKEDRLRNLLDKSEQDLNDMRSNLNLLNSEKYFLQRLSNDLKVALNTSTRQNQMLRERLKNVTKDVEFRSLPDFLSNLPGPTALDDAHIQSLMRQTNGIKPLSGLHDCLKSLKQEMASLQKQIAEKKYVVSSL